ncbi:MAG TPA: Wzz/FepE/Etk N-terminal domain-containing protein [Sphingobacteriaceae bacterium]
MKNNLDIPPSNQGSLEETVVMMIDWWQYLWSKWLVLCIAGIFGSALGLIYAYSKQPVYKAELSFVLEDDKESTGLGSSLGLANQFGFDLGSGGGAFSGDNLIELMKSRSMVEKALLNTIHTSSGEQTLIEFYIDINHIRERKDWKDNPTLQGLRFLPHADRSKFNRQQDSLLGGFHKLFIENNLAVSKLDKKLSIITVSVTSNHELFSKYFAEGLTKEVADFYIETKTKKAAENLSILEHQTDSVRRAFNAAISGVASTVDANPNPNAARQTLQVPSKRRQFDVQINQTILTQLIQNLEAAKVSLRKDKPLIQIIDRPILPLEKITFGKLKGLLMGGIIAGLMMTLILILRRIGNRISS